MKANTFYFPHDYNARNDVKCLFLRQQLGMEGYGIFWFLIESLADSGGLLPMKIVPVLAMQMQLPEVKVLAVIQNFELFMVNESGFFSYRLNSHLELRKTFSEEGKRGVQIREAKRLALKEASCPPSSDPSSKERKGNKENELKGIQAQAPSITSRLANFKEEVMSFVPEYGNDMIQKFFAYWVETNKSGTKMKWELEKTWQTNLRLIKWKSNEDSFNKPALKSFRSIDGRDAKGMVN